MLRLAQGFGFLGAEALQLGGDALLDLELEGLQAGDVGLDKEAFELERGKLASGCCLMTGERFKHI